MDLIGNASSAILSLVQPHKEPTFIVGMADSPIVKQFFDTMREALVLRHDQELKKEAREILETIQKETQKD